jgi:hypothetical protein
MLRCCLEHASTGLHIAAVLAVVSVLLDKISLQLYQRKETGKSVLRTQLRLTSLSALLTSSKKSAGTELQLERR